MAFPPARIRFDEIFEFLASTPSPEDILGFTVPQQLQERLETLLDLNRQGDITTEQQAELDEFLRVDRFFGMLKIHARKKLAAK
jgi:hypothetical protein